MPAIFLLDISDIDLSTSTPTDFLTPNSLAAMSTALPSPQPRWQNTSLLFNLANLNIFRTTLSSREIVSPLITVWGSDDKKSPNSKYMSLYYFSCPNSNKKESRPLWIFDLHIEMM